MELERMRAAISMGAEGTFTAVASHVNSTAYGERGPTRFADGAFRESLSKSTRYPLLWQHRDDSPVGVANLSEGSEGLMLSGELALEVQQAREARELLKMGAIDGVSIGFTAEKARHEKQSGQSVRVVEKARLMEVSLVTFPADPAARVMICHREGEPEEDLAEWMTEVEATLLNGDVEQFAGRTFSEANLTKLRTALGTLVDLVEKVDPGHIAELGRRAVRAMKKSFVATPKKGCAKMRAAQVHAELRRMEAQESGVDIPVGDLPLLYVPKPIEFEGDDGLDYALRRSVEASMSFPNEGRRSLLVAIVKQYLIAIGDAEEVGEQDSEAGGEESTVAEVKQ
jgi:uncharacterized protein